MADENPLYPESNSFNDRWGGLPVEAPRFNYTPQSSLIESEPRKIEPYKLTPVEGDPFERAAERLRAPYKHVNDIPEGNIPYRSNLPLIGEKFGHIIQSGATSPLAAFRGEFPVSDPETGMPTPEAIQRSQDVAALGGPGMGGLAKGEIIPGTGIESLRVFGKKLLSDTSEPGIAVAAMRHSGYPAPEIIDRVYPAVRNLETGKVSTANRGNEHADILHKLWVKEGGDPRVDTMNLYRQMLPKHETGFYDPKTKQFHSKSEEEWRNLDTPDLNPRQAMRSGMVFSDTQKPAIALSALHNIQKVESNPNYVYHATNIDRAHEIAESGKLNTYKPHEFTDQDVWPDGKTEKRNYFTKDANNTWQFAPEEGKPVLLRVKKEDHPFKRESTGDLYSTKAVDASKIEYLNADNKWTALRSDTQKPGMAVAAMQPTFYSAVEHAVGNIKSNKMPADQWLGTLNNAKGVKPEEMDWIGLKEHLADKGKEPVTKQEIQDFVNVHKTELKEVDKGAINDKIVVTSNGEHFELSELENPIVKKTLDKIGYVIQERTPSRYSQYQLPGGENYREKLLTLPNKNNAKIDEIQQRMDKIRDTGDFTKFEEYQALRNERDSLTDQNYDKQYTSTHWPDDPNVIAHVRMNDRTIEGKKSLHLEEIQSDLHQTGREKGYKFDVDKKLEDLTNEWGKQELISKGADKNAARVAKAKMIDITDEMNKLHDINSEGVPNAPFKKTWHELALKRMLREAAEKGYDRLSWTPGEAQAARYDLSKQINKLHFTKTTDGKGYLLSPETHSGQEVPVNNGLPIAEKDLANHIGKEIADKIIKQNVDDSKIHTLENIDLKIGGEGMKGFYDKMIPLALEKIGKEHGVKVKIGETGKNPNYELENLGGKWKVLNKLTSERKSYNTKAEAEAALPKNPVHYIDIPQSLKDQAIGKGFPLFSGGHIFYPVAGNPHDQNNK